MVLFYTLNNGITEDRPKFYIYTDKSRHKQAILHT